MTRCRRRIKTGHRTTLSQTEGCAILRGSLFLFLMGGSNLRDRKAYWGCLGAKDKK